MADLSEDESEIDDLITPRESRGLAGGKLRAEVRTLAGMARPAGPKLALISGRTADNPRLLKEVIEQGCTRACVPGWRAGRAPGAP